MEEVIFEDRRGAKVTNTRVMLHGTTYPVNGITSVRAVTIPPANGCAAMLVLVGIGVVLCGALFTVAGGMVLSNAEAREGGFVVLIVGISVLVIGVIVAVAAFYSFNATKATYAVVIGTAGGDRRGLITSDRAFASAVREAIDTAVTRRG